MGIVGTMVKYSIILIGNKILMLVMETLKIVAKRETYTDQGHTKEFTSARLNSKYAFTYGKVEVRANCQKELELGLQYGC